MCPLRTLLVGLIIRQPHGAGQCMQEAAWLYHLVRDWILVGERQLDGRKLLPTRLQGVAGLFRS